jgi:hypothetical protein
LLLSLVLTAIFQVWLRQQEPIAETPPDGPPPMSMPADEPAACAATGLLRPSNFNATWERKDIPAPTGAMSTFNGIIAFSNADSTIIDDALPADWTLAKQLTDTGCHPILILYGHQTMLRLFPQTFTMLFPTSTAPNQYTEMMVLIPFVQRLAGGTNMHTFVARMYLNDTQATNYGNTYFGYAKKEATFVDTPPTFTAVDGSFSVFTAESSNPGVWQNAATATIPNLAAIQEILEMPLVGMRWDPLTLKFRDQCSFFELDYDDQPARVRTIVVEHEFLQPLSSGMTAWPTLGTLGNVPSGAIEIQAVDWRLRFPPTPHCVYTP